jgi:diadenosine tetraphosphate (Ap4A) HIT family hydrolase
VWEDDQYLAVLDVFPVRSGQTIVMPKQHVESYVFRLPDDLVAGLFLAAKKVARVLDQGMGAVRTLQVMEGLGVNHAHVKLYPLVNVETEGALLHLGPKATDMELENILSKLREGGMK